MIREFLEQRPQVGIVASVAGFGTSVVSWIQAASVAIGLAGAVFGLLAGYYTWRTSRAKYQKVLAHEEQTCADCRAGFPPPLCPFPQSERPAQCPHRSTLVIHTTTPRP